MFCSAEGRGQIIIALQLIYLQRHNKAYIHAIYGPTDTLLYPGVDKVITHIDLTSSTPTFQFVSKRNVLQELAVNEDQFLDICILVGFEHSPAFPPTLHEQALKATVDMVKYYKSGHAAVSAFAEQPQVKQIQYTDTYARTRSMIKYSLVLSSEGTVIPLPLAGSPPPSHGHPNHHHPMGADIPADLHDIFTYRLPDEVYFYLSRGLLGPQALVWLATYQIVENPPRVPTSMMRRAWRERARRLRSLPCAGETAMSGRSFFVELARAKSSAGSGPPRRKRVW